jgi:hypothetical protein
VEALEREVGPPDRGPAYGARDSRSKGRVLEGSHLIVSGFCRDVFMAEHPGMRHREWTWVSREEKAAGPGMYAYTDRWENDHAVAVSFEADLDKQHPKIDPSAVWKYLCVQCAQERR